MMRWGIPLVALMVTLTSCGETAAPPGVASNVDNPTTIDPADALDAESKLVDVPGADVPDIGTQIDINEPETVEEDSGEIAPGSFKSPCITPADCDSNWCIKTPDGGQCSELCQDTCTDPSWICKPVTGVGGDPIFICVPKFLHLCEPCKTDQDCAAVDGDVGDKCLLFDELAGSFCGGACTDAITCPDEYSCTEVDIPALGPHDQCLPDTGECTCSASAIARAASTECTRSNEHGACAGERTCTVDGLSDCSAKEPTQEQCGDNIDNDCDGQTDEEDAAGCIEYYLDLDSDQYGVTEDSRCLCAKTDNYTAVQNGDCNDEDIKINPGFTEICNEIDDNCDSITDEEGALGCKDYYLDADEDSWGKESDLKCLCNPTAPYTAVKPDDCDDTNSQITPQGVETCNGVDDDCDNSTDEPDSVGCQVYFLDNDDDGFGLNEQSACLCAPEGKFTAAKGGDCNDANPLVFMDAAEVCDGIDNNCDKVIDEEGAAECTVFYEDSDKDGYGIEDSKKCLCKSAAPFLATETGDCKDTNDEIHPDASELCNGVDDNCNDVVDDEGAQGCLTMYFDNDGDGFGEPGTEKCLCAKTGKWTADTGGDCNDQDILITPGAECGKPDCEFNLFTTPKVCGGNGECDLGGETSPCPGGFLCDTATACKTVCVKDADCIPGNFCIDGKCTGQKSNGSPCFENAQCLSTYCNNGYCCDKGLCCGGKNSDCNDSNLCTDDACNPGTFQCESTPNSIVCKSAFCDENQYTEAKTCKAGKCTEGGVTTACETSDPCKSASCGLAGCKVTDAPKGVLCKTASCTDHFYTTPMLCDSKGACTTGGTTLPCPGGFVCDTNLDCLTSCESDDDCAFGFFCTNKQCIPNKPDGTQCTADEQCKSKHCNNGFCCGGGECCGGKGSDCNDDNPCTTDVCTPTFICTHDFNTNECEAPDCNGLLYTTPKFCSKGECKIGGDTQNCDGANICEFYFCNKDGCGSKPATIGTPCKGQQCLNFTYTAATICDGNGECALGGQTQFCPGGYVCENIQTCRSDCTLDSHCQPGLFCDSGFCGPLKKNGSQCTQANQCESKFCSNGFCCANGKCCNESSHCDDGNVCTTEICNLNKQCKTVFNKMQCQSGACSGTVYTTPKTCQSGQCKNGGFDVPCDSNDPCVNSSCGLNGCQDQNAAAGTQCKAPQCVGDGQLTTPKACDSKGGCSVGGKSQLCPGGYTCKDATSCAITCKEDSECRLGYYCTDTGACANLKKDGQSCTGSTQCASSHCGNGFCCKQGDCCANDSDCDDDNVCTTDGCNGFNICVHDGNLNQCEPGSCDGLNHTAPKTCISGKCIQGGDVEDCAGTDPCRTYSCGPEGCEVGFAAFGTQCEKAACVGSKLTAAQTCDGQGKCSTGGGTADCPGAFTCLDAHQCRTACTLDDHCTAGFYCSKGLCQTKRAGGDACTQSNQCSSNYCSNGYCCDGPKGLCCSQDFHCNDSNSCTNDKCSANTCQFVANSEPCQAANCSGLTFTPTQYCTNKACPAPNQTFDCSGTNVCKIYSCTTQGCHEGNTPAGIQCAPQTCSGYTLTLGKTCNGTGGCAQGGNIQPCPGGFLCADNFACSTTCSADTECQPGFYCQGGVCHSKRANGETCSQSKTCASGYCGNGYCCPNNGNDPTCCGGSSKHCDDGNVCTTDTCNGQFQCEIEFANGLTCETSSCDGPTYTAAKSCINGVCALGGSTQTCSTTEPCRTLTCSKTGCQLSNQAQGTPCDGSSCSGWKLTGSKSCDGNGNCLQGGTTGDCPGGFVCENNSACRTVCTSNSHCQPGLFCQSGICLALIANGQACDANADCQSNYCNNGFCCDSGFCCQNPSHCDDKNPCTTDTCQGFSCKAINNTSECTVSSCNGLTYTNPKTCAGGSCSAGGKTEQCSGTNPCKTYSCGATGCAQSNAGKGTICKASQCSDGILIQAQTCDSVGQCSDGGTEGPCPGNLTCLNTAQCRTHCLKDNDCSTGYYCTNSVCLPKKANGQVCAVGNECASDHCNNGFCCTSGKCCSTSSQCDDNNVCTTDGCDSFQCKTTNNTELCSPSKCNESTHIASTYCANGSCTNGGKTTVCSGTDPCKSYACTAAGCVETPVATGTLCKTASCSGTKLTQPKTCSAAGTCSGGGASGPCPGNYQCANSIECLGTCNNDTECAAGHYCQSGNCLAQKDNGDSCDSEKQCASGFCANNVCCSGGKCCKTNQQCNDNNVCTDDTCTNNTCEYKNNLSTCQSGSCNGLNYSPPKSCQAGQCVSSGDPQTCEGTNPCKNYECTETGCAVSNKTVGATCAQSVCSGATVTTPKQCSTQGSCTVGGVTAACPGGYICKDSVSCHNTCTTSSQCAAGFYCKANACLPQKADGNFCEQNAECQSEHCNNNLCCAGGVCCLSATACNDSNICTTDTCTNSACENKANAVQCGDADCAGLLYTAPKFCSNGSCTEGGEQSDCSGNNTCVSYTCSQTLGCQAQPQSEGVICSSPDCQGTTFTPSSVCNGKGTCTPSKSVECNDNDPCNGDETCDLISGCLPGTTPFTCGDLTCHPTCEGVSTCATDCECTPGYAISGGEHDNWSTSASGSTNRISAYPGCSTASYPGNEYAYSFTAPVTGTLKIRLLGGDAETDLLVLSDNGTGCNPATCTVFSQGGGSSVSFSVTKGSLYYVVVDRRQAGSVDYQLYVHYTSGTCHIPLIETWQRTPFPRAWTVQANWQSAQNSPYGATHAKFTGKPLLTKFDRSLTSPIFDTTGCAKLNLSFDWRYFHQAGQPPHAGLKLHAEISSDGGGSWSEVFVYDSKGGDTPGQNHTVDVTPLSGSNQARVRFRVDGDNSGFMNRYQVDNVTVAP